MFAVELGKCLNNFCLFIERTLSMSWVAVPHPQGDRNSRRTGKVATPSKGFCQWVKIQPCWSVRAGEWRWEGGTLQYSLMARSVAPTFDCSRRQRQTARNQQGKKSAACPVTPRSPPAGTAAPARSCTESHEQNAIKNHSRAAQYSYFTS